MGLLRHAAIDISSVLEAVHLVGRSPQACLEIDKPYISAQHASIRWAGECWEVKDLSSRNGTLVEEARLKPGHSVPLRQGALISFGRREQTWELVDDSPPRVMVLSVDHPCTVLFVEGDLLALPSSADPRATVFRDSEGWKLERDDGVLALTNRKVFDVNGRAWRFSTPDNSFATSTVESIASTAGHDVQRVRLVLRVSRDEEHVEMIVERGRQRVDLGSRAHNYLLLLLARKRMEETAGGLPSTACGWLYQDELVDALQTSPERLNVDIFRIRKQFASMDVANAANIIERRSRTKQLRIGIESLVIEPI
jgi:hypothetical protein